MSDAATNISPLSQTPTTSLSCSQKIVVTVELENNKLYETERLNFAVSCVNRCVDGLQPFTATQLLQRHHRLQVRRSRRHAPPPLCCVPCSPTDQCPCPCNYATDPTCACRDLRQEVSVAATKSPVYASYPVTFYRYFNGRPYEVRVLLLCCPETAALRHDHVLLLAPSPGMPRQ